MIEQNRFIYEFGPFRLDANKRVLTKEGEPVKLFPKEFDTLVALVKRSGELLEKDELMQQVWGDTIVEESNLTTNISHLRKLLGENQGRNDYIVTVPGKGYRFVAGVRPLDEVAVTERTRVTLEQEEEFAEQVKALPLPGGASIFPSRALLLTGLAALIVLGGFLWFRRSGQPAPNAAPAAIRSIAVLPFKPLVLEGRDEPLEMGMADTLITSLSGIKNIVVRPVATVRKYNALDQDPLAAGKEQSVDAVLDGSIQKTSDRVRVTARLLRVSDGQTLWSDKFDLPLTDLFALQDSISEKVAMAMAVKLTGEERALLTRHHTENTDAYQLYLKGRVFYRQQTEDSVEKGIDCFERAIAIDRNYALAYTGKADVYSAYSSVFLPPAEAMPKAREAAEKALEIDDRLAEAHYSMARVKLWADWDWSGAESEYKRALELKPNDAEIRVSYSTFLTQQKRFDEALVELKRVLELDPTSPFVIDRAARVPYFARRYDEALSQSRHVVALHPKLEIAHRHLGSVLTDMGMHEEGIAELQRAVDLHRMDANLSQLGYAYALLGRRDEAMALVKEIEGLAKRRYVSPVRIARIYVGLGERGLAFKWLQKGYEDRSDHLLSLGVDPTFDAVRSDPRFVELLRRVGLAPLQNRAR
jgi:DNA-binding winged helix-turn-helix (wHTH) protein/TolB-like protein/tetratricopeptide (TPR) repeat protein